MKATKISLLFVILISFNYICTIYGALLNSNQNVIEAPQAALPGFNGIITQTGLNYATQVALSILEKKLSTLSIPEVTGNKDSITYEITDIVIHNLKIPSGVVKIDPNVGLTVSISGVSGELTANWHGRENIWPHPSGSGSAQVDLSQLTINSVLQINEISGKLHVIAQSVSTNIGSMDLHFSGSHLDFLLNLLKDIFGNAIKHSAENAITSTVQNEIDTTLDAELKTLSDEIIVGHVAELDFSLVSQPVFSATNFLLPLKGEFYQLANPVEAPFTPTNLPTTPQNTEEFQSYLDEYVANSASYAFWKAGKMSMTITPADVPATSPIQFNTASWQGLVPALYRFYPNYNMTATIQPVITPTVKFSPAGGAVVGEGSIQMFVNGASGLIPVFTLGLNVTADGTAAIRGQNITGNLTATSSQVWLMSSEIGTFPTTQLQALVQFLTLAVIVPYFNSFLAVGVPLPVFGGFTFVNPDLSWGPGYIFISSNLNYAFPKADV